MVDLNHVVLIGRLVKDAELKTIASGQAVCKFSIAVNRRRKNGDQWEDEANYFDIVVWGRQGETLHQYLQKGKMVAIDGELKQDRWEQDGQKRSKVEIVAAYLQLLGGNSGGGNSGNRGQGYNSGQNNGSGSNFNSGPNFNSGQGFQSPGNNLPADDNFADDIPF